MGGECCGRAGMRACVSGARPVPRCARVLSAARRFRRSSRFTSADADADIGLALHCFTLSFVAQAWLQPVQNRWAETLMPPPVSLHFCVCICACQYRVCGSAGPEQARFHIRVPATHLHKRIFNDAINKGAFPTTCRQGRASLLLCTADVFSQLNVRNSPVADVLYRGSVVGCACVETL